MGDAAVEKARLSKAQAEAQEHRNRRARGAVLELVEAERVLAAADAAIRARVLAVPERLAQELATTTDAKRCHELLAAALHDALEELARLGLGGHRGDR